MQAAVAEDRSIHSNDVTQMMMASAHYSEHDQEPVGEAREELQSRLRRRRPLPRASCRFTTSDEMSAPSAILNPDALADRVEERLYPDGGDTAAHLRIDDDSHHPDR